MNNENKLGRKKRIMEREKMVRSKTIDKIFLKMEDNSNLVAVSQEDICKITDLGMEISLKPKKDSKVKGVIVFLEGTKNLTLGRLGNMAEKITKPLPDDTQILWGARINEDIIKDRLNVVYIY